MKKNQIQLYNSNRAVDVKRTAWNALSEESQKAYQSDYNIFFEFIKKDVKRVNANDILLYIEHLRKNKYKANSVNRKIAALSKMFKVMIYAGEIKQNPVETLKQFKNISMKVNREIRISLTMDDVRKAIKKGRGQNEQIIMIVRLLAMTGLRISELINIKKEDIKNYDRLNMIVRVIGKGRKERYIYIPKKIMAEIDVLWPDSKFEYLLYTRRKNPYNRHVLWVQIRDFFHFTINKTVHPHMLRHAFITQKISVERQDIKAVSRYAGHTDVATTLNMYVDKALDVKTSKIEI